MTYRELPMIDVRELLRRRAAGQATRKIARETGIDRKTVERYVKAAHNRRVHSETKQTPLDRFLEGPSVMRPSPSVEKLRRAFQIEEKRRQRRSDGTISVEGRRYEVPSRYRTLEEITVRFARWDLSALDMIDARTGTVLCVLHPLDRTRNADGLRRVIGPVANAEEARPKGVAPLLAKLMADYAATGLPPAYLPLDERRETLADAEEKS